MKLAMPVLETSRLLLRPVELADAADLLEIYGDPRVMLKNSMMTPLVDIDAVLAFIQTSFLAYQHWGLPQAMVMETLESGHVIGISDYHTIHDTTGELGYLLAHRYWHLGYMKEAIEAMVYAGFMHTGFSCIEAEYDPVNKASMAILHAHGFGEDTPCDPAILLNDGKYHTLMKCRIRKDAYDEKEHHIHIYEGGYTDE